MILPPKPKKPSKKAILDKTKPSHPRLLESSECDVFRVLDFWLLKVVFGFGGIWFISWRIDCFNFAIFLGHIKQHLVFKKNMNPHKFSVFLYEKSNYNSWKKKKYFLKKNMTNFTAIFLHDTGWLNALFQQLIEIPKLQKICEHCLANVYPFLIFQTYTSAIKKKSPSSKKCV